MKEPLQDLSNTREVLQQQIMEELAVTGECFLCPSVIKRIVAKYPEIPNLSIYEGKDWFIKHNAFPYEGTVLHLLIIPKRHVTRLEDLSTAEFLEIQEMVAWVNKTYNVEGASMFIRYGKMSYTGATLAHMHFHILHGVEKSEDSESIKPKLGYKEK